MEAPIKGAAFSSVVVQANNFPSAHAFLQSTLIEGRQDVQLSTQGAAELLRIGLFAPCDAIPQTVRYDIANVGAVGSAAARLRSEVEALSAEPVHSQGLRLPEEWQEPTLRFVSHHRGSIWAPVRTESNAAAIENNSEDDELAETWTPGMELDAADTRAQFEREGFAILEHLLPAAHVLALGRYFRALADEGFLARDDEGGTRRFIAHNHPIANFWHDQLNERVAQLVGQRTKPSYSFVSVYSEGGDLFWHTDRPPCEYTLTLLMDYAPLTEDGRSSWPLKVRGRDGALNAIQQRVGEALIFKGRELKHSRDVLPAGHRSSSLLFHFVNEDYDGVMG